MQHPMVDIERWKKVFPIGKSADAWEDDFSASMTSPRDLAIVEQVRVQASQIKDLGRSVPVDIFLWATGAPNHPYLTKIGGVPHREKTKKWPQSRDGEPMTFFMQFCFLDSQDILPRKLDGDVMLVFLKEPDSVYGHWDDPNDIRIEFASKKLKKPTLKKDCPTPSFFVPELAGVIHRTFEYPDSGEVFESLGLREPCLFATTQSTKIGTETYFIQNDLRSRGKKLLCTFNSLDPLGGPFISLAPLGKWPLINLKVLPKSAQSGGMHGGGKYNIMFGDLGCLYFLISNRGKVSWAFDCY